jgi:hypothetical protein
MKAERPLPNVMTSNAQCGVHFARWTVPFHRSHVCATQSHRRKADSSSLSYMILKDHFIYIIIKLIYLSLWYCFCSLNKYYVDAHHVTDVKQHGQEVLGYVQYAFSG